MYLVLLAHDNNHRAFTIQWLKINIFTRLQVRELLCSSTLAWALVLGVSLYWFWW